MKSLMNKFTSVLVSHEETPEIGVNRQKKQVREIKTLRAGRTKGWGRIKWVH